MNSPRKNDRNETRVASPASNRFRIAAPAWQVTRTRDFGTGYGNSSGYASERRYVDDWGQTRFRLV